MSYEFKPDADISATDLHRAKEAAAEAITLKTTVTKSEADARVRFFVYACLQEMIESLTTTSQENTNVH